MIRLYGKTVCGGIVIGTAFVFDRKPMSDIERKPASPSDEWARLSLAVSTVRNDLTACMEGAGNDTARDILEVHRMMLEDEDITAYLKNAVTEEGLSAEAAIAGASRYFSDLFAETGDDYLIARIDDIRDVMGGILSCLSREETLPEPDGPFVLFADELFPGDLMRFDRKNLAGVVMGFGTVASHVSILLREMGIPALICGKALPVRAGTNVLLNADCGTVIFDYDENGPDAGIIAALLTEKSAEQSPFDGLPCRLYVNIGSPEEIGEALMERCDGIGLFRSEFLYSGRPDLPGEEEQFSVYRTVLEKANGKPVTVRTFDIGSDKSVEALPLPKEENAALGFRGLRVYPLYPEAFRAQLRALLRAAVFGDLRILYPMVTSEKELAGLRQTVLMTARELEEEGLPYRIPPQGAMIETPAAALLSDEIAGQAEFLSVGTNDLTQYTLALDRQSGRLDRYEDPRHRAVLSLVRMAAESAHRHGIPIGICGELASEPGLTGKWTAAGIDYLSVSPSVIPRNERKLSKKKEPTI